MNADQQMRDIVEKAGEKWHYWVIEDSTLNSKDVLGGHCYGGHGYECSCGFRRVNRVNWSIGSEAHFSGQCINPSPTDLNELFRLLHKLQFSYILRTKGDGSWNHECFIYKDGKAAGYGVGMQEADALRTAIWQAIQEVEK